MNSYYAYSFLAGMYIGGYTNFFSKLVISSLVIYMIHPENFNIKKFEPLYERIHENTYPYLSKIYSFNDNTTNSTNPLLETSPKTLPILKIKK